MNFNAPPAISPTMSDHSSLSCPFHADPKASVALPEFCICQLYRL